MDTLPFDGDAAAALFSGGVAEEVQDLPATAIAVPANLSQDPSSLGNTLIIPDEAPTSGLHGPDTAPANLETEAVQGEASREAADGAAGTQLGLGQAGMLNPSMDLDSHDDGADKHSLPSEVPATEPDDAEPAVVEPTSGNFSVLDFKARSICAGVLKVYTVQHVGFYLRIVIT